MSAKSKASNQVQDHQARQQTLLEMLADEDTPGEYRQKIPLNEIARPMLSVLPTPKFIADVKLHGVKEPLMLRQPLRKGGKFPIIQGNRRWLAADAAELESVPGIIVAVSAPHAATLRLRLNHLRAVNEIGDVEAIRELLEGGFNDDDIAATSGLTKAEITQRRKLALALPQLRQAVLEGRCAPSLFRDAAGLPPTQQRALVARLAEDDCERLTGADLREVKQVRQRLAVQSLPAALFQLPPGIAIPRRNGVNGASQKDEDGMSLALTPFAEEMFWALDEMSKAGAFDARTNRKNRAYQRSLREANEILERARAALPPSLEPEGGSDD